MKPELVRSIQLPNDQILNTTSGNYRTRAQDFVTGVADRAEVEFVIDNLGEAVEAAHQDFCCNGNDKNYFVIDTGTDRMYEMTFDLASLRHLFGIFGNKWQQTELCEKLKSDHPDLRRRIGNRNLTWIDQIQEAFNPQYKTEIITHECSDSNELKEKLNWQKMMIKIFAFINMGKLEDGTTIFYKENRNQYSKGKPSYLMIRSLRNGELENIEKKNSQYYDKQLIIKLVEEEYQGQICLTPQSIYIVNKPLKLDGSRDRTGGRIYLEDYGIKNDNIMYKFFRTIRVVRKRGDKYAGKGNK